MEQLMTKEESYAERRQLFKDIWKTAMDIDEKNDIMNKPKVIKTLRLSETDRCVAQKKKKQKIKNLRVVCNKLLHFCDRQDADDLFYEQMAVKLKFKKKKPLKVKKKIRKVKSVTEPTKDVTPAKAATSEWKNSISKKTISRNTSPIRVKRTSILRTEIVTAKRNPNILARRRVTTKNNSKKSKPSVFEQPNL